MAIPAHPPANAFVTQARKVYNPIGFAKGYNFMLWVIFLGAFLGFTLARLQFLDFYGVFCSKEVKSPNNHAAPGECFYWLQKPYTVGITLHLAGILPAALLACVQFIPVVRHKAIFIHRVNGYIVIILSVVATAGIFIILPRSFGGGLDVQTAGGTLAIAFLWALLMAYINIKRLQIDQHRAWMLRAWFWAGSIITERVLMIIVQSIPTSEPRYYAMPCDKVDSMLGNYTLALYPACASFYSGEVPYQNVAVRAEFNHPTSVVEVAAALDAAFGAVLWLSFILSIVGVEIYLHLTSAETERLRRISCGRQLEAGMKNPGSVYLASDRLRDAE
ncbi:hypothetical protein HD806DRAFT_544108 [Xylariaceae sp. AK1471]|nr:hypothetical protein HD806DRAFT_544108 [Xylariaceae sp. AK1471]